MNPAERLIWALDLIAVEVRGPKTPERAAFLTSLAVLVQVADSASVFEARRALESGLAGLRLPVERLALPGEVAELHLQLEAARAELKRERAVFLERERRTQVQP